jgi:NADH-quinone oxidoreductase subunit D
MFIGGYPDELGRSPRQALHERESVLAVMEELTGGRMHYMFNRVGGLKEDMPEGWLDRVEDAAGGVRRLLPQLLDATLGDDTFTERTRGVGVLDRDVVAAYGVSGPVARASGVPTDLRRDEPYLAYNELRDVWAPSLREEGDALARFAVLLDEIGTSLDLVDGAAEHLRGLPRGPINVRLPKIVKAPEGATYAWTESPGGVNGYYLVSRGEKTPWRLKLRTPGFNNAAALPHVVTGARVEDLVPILGSMFFVIGDIDK